jgi:ornithine carbamoyltransferase
MRIRSRSAPRVFLPGIIMAVPHHFLALSAESPASVRALLAQAAAYKNGHASGRRYTDCAGKVIGLFFEKASLRTRISFEVAIQRLGGAAIFQAGKIADREPEKDFAGVLSRYVDALVLRTYRHKTIVDVAKVATVPVINALSDACHPCQALGDLLTIQERFGRLDRIRVAFIGDGNNVARSLAVGCSRVGASFALASPRAYQFEKNFIRSVGLGQRFEMTEDPARAAASADVIYTDVWVSMGQEKEAAARRKVFRPYQVDARLLTKAKKSAIVMHCMPAIRGEEVTAGVLDGPQSVIYDQAENRLHAQQAVLKRLLSK